MTKEEEQEYREVVGEVLIHAFDLQEFLWDDLSYTLVKFDVNDWIPLFEKRIDKIKAIDVNHPHFKVELRKRLPQQAALSIKAIVSLKNNG